MSGFVNVDGEQLYFEDAGKGHPLIFLHAGFVDCRMWDGSFDVFAERYHVIRYDLRGFGK